jgi:hypothetical protein
MTDSPSLRTRRRAEEETRSLGVWRMRCCCLLLLVLPLGGCDRDSYYKLFGYTRDSLLRKYAPQEDESLALRYIEMLRQNRFDQIEDRLDPGVKDEEIRNTLAGMAQLFPAREPASIKPVEVDVVRSADSSKTSITLEYEFGPAATLTNGRAEVMPKSWLLAQAVIQKRDGGDETISGLHVMTISEPVESINEFTLLDKGLPQHVGLCLAILVSVFSLYVFVLCLRTKGRMRWIWLILIVVGVCRITVNWTTGQWLFSLWTIQVPPVMMFCTPYGPWIVQISAPLGAITFILLKKSLTVRPTAPTVQSPTSG